jgi:transposase
MKRLAATKRGSLRSTKVINALQTQGTHKEQPAMEYGAIDLHLRRSQFRIVREDGLIVKEGKFDTTRADLTRIFGARARLRVLLESSTDSEWVAQQLEALGHEVIVADPNYAPMYGSRVRKVKTDGRDTAALTEACRLGIYRRAHRVSAPQRARRQQLRIRRHLVQMRSRSLSLVRALLRQEGWRLSRGTAETVPTRLAKLALPEALRTVLAPLVTWLEELNTLVATADAEVATTAATDPMAQHLMTAPGVGAVIALSFIATLDDPGRFDGDPARASAFLGVVPSEDSSGERRHKGAITKAGPRELRALLVQASWVIWRSRRADSAALRDWAHALAARRGRRIAIIALARRLSRILFAMWRDGTDFRVGARPVAA